MWTQGDNGQVFDDYKEIYIKMLLQPTENSVTDFNIGLRSNMSGFGGGYGAIGLERLHYPSNNTKTILFFVHLRKTFDGIEQTIRKSYNDTVTSKIYKVNDTIDTHSSFKNDAINPPEVLEEVSFAQHFECIKIGSYVANMPPNCRFMIYGIK